MALFALISFLVVTSLGTLYPIYLSYKAIKNNDLQSLEVLLMFWIVMGIINAVESTFGWLLRWIPFFYHCKSLFLLWLTLPQIQGSTYVYVTYIHPFLLQHEATIDQWLAEAKEKCKTTGANYLNQMVEKIKEIILNAITSANQARSANGQSINQPDPQTSRDDGPSSYAINLLRQLGPTASAIFQPMQNQLSDSSLFNRPFSVRSPAADHLSHDTNPAPSRDGLDGYQIPEPSASSESSSARSGPSFPEPVVPLRNNNGNGASMGYDEIGLDEASGSEKEWLLRRPSPNSLTSSERGRVEEQHNEKGPHDSFMETRRLSGPNSSWFKWTTKPTNVDELKKKS
ncbi:hypothetical protein O181_013889 [Austropuccinia psidii MF-1]|uniref:Protein YOP1 n=1 Tax=Austropuccinia psidii MF-1 TaxID=1389203 RepID=A0A9Q3GPB5_9BASI|nr:hypothetical protein [Austropuccinia psidii MF-1]